MKPIRFILAFLFYFIAATSFAQTLPLAVKKAGPETKDGSYNNSYQFTQELRNTLKTGTAAYKTTVRVNPNAAATASYKSSYFGTDTTGRGFFYNDLGHFTFAESGQTLAAAASALVELKSTAKGFLIPRMTTVNRDAITSPANGLMVYNTSTNAFNFYNGSAWTAIGTGTVTSVSGTANRITSTGGATPVIDISGSYIGQSSITTLGTITTGTWNGNVITPARGGTGTNIGTSALVLGTANTSTGEIAFSNNSNANTLLVRSGISTGDISFIYPATDGDNGQFLQTDGNGLTSWQTISATSGTFTPTVIGSTNTVSVGMGAAHYTRVGDIVTVYGNFVVEETAASTETTVTMSLPIPSTFTVGDDLAGVANFGLQVDETAIIQVSGGSDSATLSYSSGTAPVAGNGCKFTYQYIVK